MAQQAQNKEFSVNLAELNRKLFLIILPIALILCIPFFILYDTKIFEQAYIILVDNFFISLGTILAGMLIHELIHGLVWALFVKNACKSIKFGFSKHNFSPYCHCMEPIKLKYYIWGGIMPAFVLGFIPIVISWFTGLIAFMFFGFVFSLAAGSDIIICWKLRNENFHILIQDFPDKPGCYFIDKE